MGANEEAGWSEENSREFIDYGRYFVPERESQMAIISRLIPAVNEPFHGLELCCGEGLLAEVILERDLTGELLARRIRELLLHRDAFLWKSLW